MNLQYALYEVLTEISATSLKAFVFCGKIEAANNSYLISLSNCQSKCVRERAEYLHVSTVVDQI